MSLKPNLMKAKIAGGQVALGCSVMFPSPQIVEMLGYAGFDWVLIDCEHGSISLADVELMAMAADAVGVTAIARPRGNSAADIQSVMDRGVMGVQVPHVNTAQDARDAVPFVRGAWRGLRVVISQCTIVWRDGVLTPKSVETLSRKYNLEPPTEE